ncbi:MAG: photosystem reaction center subunit H [Rhodobacteraceae bacterium]|jgi:hypothetical protein|uniref:PRC-barrel protein n=1 Tax=Salipiger profundus TaxID=1229727 RepID=A0A1U7DAF3_9RHOB|nr:MULTISPECIES: PRC-barrel domain-containing protein [Salipiger]APX25056.1 PRC-barrel protein [Salipiger profundus]MAB07563.1 photosystem reaction center subunit H [Paracoccaceae bacterium]SFD11811.1 PRC-barrel domain-containing protein [Salipiger profundus]
MNRLTMTAAAIAITAGTTAWADNHGDSMENAEQNMEQAGEQMEQAAENTGDAIEQGAENAAQSAENTAEQAGEEMQQAADEAGQEMEQAGEEMQQAADEAGNEMEQTANNAEDVMFPNNYDGLIRARDIIGGTVYAIDADGEAAGMEDGEEQANASDENAEETEMAASDDSDTMSDGTEMASSGGEMQQYDSVSDEWDNVGEIEDIVMNADGSFEGIVAEVGGFLDIGDKHIHISMTDVQLIPVDDVSYAIVTNYTRDQLMEMEDVDESFMN